MGEAYNQEAFRYFLAVERKRAEQSPHSFFLVLVHLRKNGGSIGPIRPAVAAGIFQGLQRSVREVDFVGWFREERIAAAVLTQGAQTPATDSCSGIGKRITDTLSGLMPQDSVGHLHVRILEMRSNQQG